MATAAPATGIGRIVTGITADETQIYWSTLAGTGPLDSFSLMSARKDGTGVPKTMVSGLTKPTSLGVDGGFVYWATLETAGTIARCPTSGCTDGKPEVVASQQLYPHYLTASAGVLFWLNETEASEKLTQTNRPAKIVGCVTSSCADTIEVLDESMAGSVIDPFHVLSLPSDQMVADAEALYWFGDITLVTGPDGGAIGFEASVRRLARTPGK
jgi:hypothetical protein